jgi:uncharacterized protein YbaR (Trm112 family)
MKRKTLELLACPTCHGELALSGDGDGETIETGALVCARCQCQYPIKEGIVHFIEPGELAGLNARFARFYDWFTHTYFLFNNVAFFFLGGVRVAPQLAVVMNTTEQRVPE